MRLLHVLAVAALALGPAGPVLAAGPTPSPAPAPTTARTASADPATLTFGVQAATQRKPDTRPHYTYTAVPGADIVDYVAISNYSKAPLSLHLYAGDAFTNADGGFDLTPAQAKTHDLGSWVSIANPHITLAPRTRSILPFRLAIPANAAPGDHTGGIVAGLVVTTRGRQGDVVTVEHRLAERIYLRVPGAIRPALAISAEHTAFTGPLNPFGRGRSATTYRITNTGNVRLGAKVSAEVHNLLGSRSIGRHDVAELLPGSSLEFSGDTRLFPALHASVRIKVVPVRLSAAGDDGDVASASYGFWTIPWALLVLLTALALSVAVVRRRLSRRPASAHAAPRRARSRGRLPRLEVS